jgi:hypothetical protein
MEILGQISTEIDRPDLARAWREGLRFARERFGDGGRLVTSENA